MPISYKQRRENAVKKAVALIRPYIQRYLESTDSAFLDASVAGPVVEGVRKHFYGFKGEKNEVIKVIDRLSSDEINRAILKALRLCLASPELQEHLKVRNALRKAYLEEHYQTPIGADPDVARKSWGKDRKGFRVPKRRPKMF